MTDSTFVCLKTPWHRQSYDLFLQERLPQLLLERGFPLVGYQALSTNRTTCRVTLHLAAAKGDFSVEYDSLPQPDEGGVFLLNDELWVVVPVASSPDLENARIECVGDLLEGYLDLRIGQIPVDPSWEESMVRAWLPLETWIEEFLVENAQRLDTTNGYSRITHLRRLVLRERGPVVMPGQQGRVCPFEMPEGPNMGRVFTIACGAQVQEGKLVIVDHTPLAGLGVTASMIPFLEHNDHNRLLMGANMMRQWLPSSEVEPPLVQTGSEPGGADFWIGRNLLTAFISWGAGTYLDGIVISQSCARRLNYPYPAEPGDKLSNRHGTMGVVGAVLPDEEMPHLEDDTPVELVYNFASLHMRMNFGQILEAMLSRVVRAEGLPAIVPPYSAPTVEEIRTRWMKAKAAMAAMGSHSAGTEGSGDSLRERLRMGKDGPVLDSGSLVGWVYWGRLAHLAKGKVKLWTEDGGQQQLGEMEMNALAEAGAYENLLEMVSTRSARRKDVPALVTEAAAGAVRRPAFSPYLVNLQERLAAAGIWAHLVEDKLAFSLKPLQDEVLQLAVPLPHPWLREVIIDHVGRLTDIVELRPMEETNRRLLKMLTSGAPNRLVEDAKNRLAVTLEEYFSALVNPANLSLGDQPFTSGEPQVYSARAVAAPGETILLDQVGLPDAIAWSLFAPWAGEDHNHPEAIKKLDEMMRDKWVLVNRPPTTEPTAILAFHPVRESSNAIQIHPLVCEWLNMDFDGDQVAVYLPLSEAAQREAGEKLSVAGHLRRDASLLGSLLPDLDILFGLGRLAQTEQGRSGLAQILGCDISQSLLTRKYLGECLNPVLASEGVKGVIHRLEQAWIAGLAAVKQSGSSLHFALAEDLELPPVPEDSDPAAWTYFREELEQVLLGQKDRPESVLSPQLMMILQRGKGLQQLAMLVGGRGVVRGLSGKHTAVRHGLAEGLTMGEMNACVAGARSALAAVWQGMERMGEADRQHRASSSYAVLARARRSENPGVVFARAAAMQEVDPLVDVQSRILLGLPV